MKQKIEYDKTELCVLGFADIESIMAIQEAAFLEMEDKGQLRRNTVETFSVCFELPSIAYGVKYNGALIAFGMLYCAGETDENLARDGGHGAQNLQQIANVKVIIVLPEYRGNGLQKFLIERLEEHARKQNIVTLMATVDPLNKHSLKNFYACGYIALKSVMKYGGMSRILLKKELNMC